MVKQMGGWKSDFVAQGYIDISMHNKNKIFQSLTHAAASKASSRSREMLTAENEMRSCPVPSTSAQKERQVLDDTAAASALLVAEDEIVSAEILKEFFVDENSFDAVTCVHENFTETLQPEEFTTTRGKNLNVDERSTSKKTPFFIKKPVKLISNEAKNENSSASKIVGNSASKRKSNATEETMRTAHESNKVKRLFSRVTPIPRIACEYFMLSAKVSMSILLAVLRLLVPPSKKSLLGETVLITKAGHGVGRELALQLAPLGCIVICWDTDVDANRSTMNLISKNGGEVYGFAVDVSKRSDILEAIRMMRKAGIGDVSILINTAEVGGGARRALLEHDDKDIRKIFDVNVMSQFWTIQSVLPSMLLNKKGHIVSVSGVCGLYGLADRVPFCSSKFAARGLIEALSEELRLTGHRSMIQFTNVYPFCVNAKLSAQNSFRFPFVFGIVSPECAAKEIIRAIQRNYEECTIPRSLMYFTSIDKILPKKTVTIMKDFITRNERQ
ncbi:17-beta-hydroxysteroid dehydrogenase 13-like [Trichogramma pretiosum]|uniref:17-beta-hydroxysteroid dehydrogenase 13-like n=1 Tax=Trichogramma pretiosum TaxID=7493 RepID=UPI000C719282|nr:17-beta-hydroxysteroid dehydrogenase 13-like [Trichogramma pretiosum]